jgi:hypothetical protein
MTAFPSVERQSLVSMQKNPTVRGTKTAPFALTCQTALPSWGAGFCERKGGNGDGKRNSRT